MGKILEGLSFHDKKVLVELQKLGGRASITDISEGTGLDQATVMRSALALTKGGLAEMQEERVSIVGLTQEGEKYAREGLPERRMMVALAGYGPRALDEIAARAGLSDKEAQIAVAWLRRKGWAEFIRCENKSLLLATKEGEAALSKKLAEEVLLEKLSARKCQMDEVPAELRGALDMLLNRRLVGLEHEVRRELGLTQLGNRVLGLGVELVEEVSELTHELLVTGRWREVRLKRYDVVAPGAPVYPGKIHPQQQVVDELREILLEMGFVEIKGKLVESEFWNFDALFQAQDHPAREIHASLSLSKPERTKLPSPALVRRVAIAHERGVAGSTGWGYKFNVDVSQKPVLCSQTTAATVRYLASRPKPPVKIFCIDRVYRHEKIDYKHLAEFYQAEGIVMDKGLTLRDMLGYLKQIVTKLGFKKIRFTPSYFPYTEPSAQAHVYHEKKREWLEILGAGIFRPELLRPLGIRYPVLAWGVGLSRLIMAKLGLEDIRDLFSNDLQWISSFVYKE